MVIKTAMTRKSLDNVTCTIVAFNNFLKSYDNLQNAKDKLTVRVKTGELKNIRNHYQTEGNLTAYPSDGKNTNDHNNPNGINLKEKFNTTSANLTGQKFEEDKKVENESLNRLKSERNIDSAK